MKKYILIVFVGILSFVFFKDKIFLSKEKYYNMKSMIPRAEITNAYETRFVGVLLRDIDGEEVFVNPRDTLIGERIIRGGEWEKHLRNLIEQVVKKDDKVLCLGAHEGIHMLLMSNIVGDKGHIYAFEPNPGILRYTKANVYFAKNKNITLYEKAAFSENTKLRFASAENTAVSRILSNEEKVTGKDLEIEVDAVKIDDIPEIKEVNIIQMDIEGAEPEAIKGSRSLIENSPNLEILQEWDIGLMGGKDKVVDYIKFWRDLGFDFAEITCEGLYKKTDKELLELPHTDVILSRNMDKIIFNFKKCKIQK